LNPDPNYADIYRLIADGPSQRAENWKALGLDTGAAVIPFATGAGLAYRAARAAEAARILSREAEIISRASRAVGNEGIGTASRETADVLGRNWVGDGYTRSKDGRALISQDKTRVFRPPSMKPKLKKEQANFIRRDPKTGKPLSNSHLDIKDP